MKINPEKHAWDLASARLPPYLKAAYDKVQQKRLVAEFDPKKRPIRLSKREKMAILRAEEGVRKIRANRRGNIRIKQVDDDARRASLWLKQEFPL